MTSSMPVVCEVGLSIGEVEGTLLGWLAQMLQVCMSRHVSNSSALVLEPIFAIYTQRVPSCVCVNSVN